MTGALSPTHWLIILAVVLLLFGAKRLPDAARGVGKSLRIFKAETTALSNSDTDDTAGAGKTAAEPAALETGAGAEGTASGGATAARPVRANDPAA